jgi:hypothetical protein
MSKWEKLNKEFDDALNSMTLEDWDNWYHRVERKRMNQNKMKQKYKCLFGFLRKRMNQNKMKQKYKCLLGFHEFEVLEYSGYVKIIWCKHCEKVKTIKLKSE